MTGIAGVHSETPSKIIENEPSRLKSIDRTDLRTKVALWCVIFVIAVAYLASLSRGHVFTNDDFGAYVMHAANLVAGRPYTFIHYVPNPKALWLAPTNGYPPIYPLLLAPIYKIWGLNLRALKIVTSLCFAGFLIVFAFFTRPLRSPAVSICALLVISANPIFWDQREYLLSEFPYLLFSFGALLAIQNAYESLTLNDMRADRALLVALLLYCAYGTRTVGVALVPALVAGDLAKFKRPSRFLLVVLSLTAVLFLAQGVLIAWPKGYVSAFHFSLRTIAGNGLYYSKTLSYAWENGFSKGVQIIFALFFTALATAGFLRCLAKRTSATEFYVLGYMGVLFTVNWQSGLRGLLPILPLYLVYGLREFEQIAERLKTNRVVAIAVLVAVIGVAYFGEFRKESKEPLDPNVQDATAQQLFGFLRTNSQPSDVLVFPKPRSLALFTDRDVASLYPDEPAKDSAQFLKDIHADLVVKPRWSPPSWDWLLEANVSRAVEVFHNSDYQVFRFR